MKDCPNLSASPRPFLLSSDKTGRLGLYRYVFLSRYTIKYLHTHIHIIKKNSVKISRWWFLRYFVFSPLFREDSHFDEHIFQRGWFNHQPDIYIYIYVSQVMKRAHQHIDFEIFHWIKQPGKRCKTWRNVFAMSIMAFQRLEDVMPVNPQHKPSFHRNGKSQPSLWLNATFAVIWMSD